MRTGTPAGCLIKTTRLLLISIISVYVLSCASTKQIELKKVEYENKIPEKIFDFDIKDIEITPSIVITDTVKKEYTLPKKWETKLQTTRKVFDKETGRVQTQVNEVKILFDDGKIAAEFQDSKTDAVDITKIQAPGFFDKIEIWFSAFGFIIITGIVIYFWRKK